MVKLTGVLYMSSKVQRERRSETATMFTYISSQMCGSMAQNHILLSTLQTRTWQIRNKQIINNTQKFFIFIVGFVQIVCVLLYVFISYSSEFLPVHLSSPVTEQILYIYSKYIQILQVLVKCINWICSCNGHKPNLYFNVLIMITP